ncbi:MAG: MFS transporter [Thiotrichaceae bacterium]
MVKHIPAFVITALSLLLLLYIGYSDAKHSYQQAQFDRLIFETEIATALMEDFLKIGLPLDMISDFLEKKTALGKFAGFEVFNNKNFNQNEVSITVSDTTGKIYFSNNTASSEQLGELQGAIEGTQILVYRQHYQLKVELYNKFEELAGYLQVYIPKTLITQVINKEFKYLPIILLLSLLLFFILLFFLKFDNQQKSLFIAYGTSFAIMSIFVIITLLSVYEQSAHLKIRELSNSLTQRLSAVVESNIEFGNVDGLHEILLEYQKLDGDIEKVALIENNKITQHHSDIGEEWPKDNDNEYLPYIADSSTQVAIALRPGIIFNKVLQAVKNLVTLFIGSCLMAYLFFTIAMSIQNKHTVKKDYDASDHNRKQRSELLEQTIMPIWFLMVFADSLTISFLPHYLHNILSAQHILSFMESVLFSSFFIGFTLVLVPASKFIKNDNIEKAIIWGIFIYGATMIGIAFSADFYQLLILRVISGAAQGLIFISVQNYIQNIASNDMTTKGGTILVFGFNGGIISGSAIGSLLVGDIGEQGVFFSAAIISFITALFTLLFVPQLNKMITMFNLTKKEPLKTDKNLKQPAAFSTIIRDGEFLRTWILVGATSKAVYTGVTIFAIPLLMQELSYSTADIGLALMVYAGIVLVINQKVDWMVRKIKLRYLLTIAIILSGIGVMMLGLVDSSGGYTTALIFTSMAVLGLANGMISAPVVSHILDTNTNRTIGKKMTTAIYRLLERIGHIAGPLIIGWLLIQSGNDLKVISLFGMAMLVFGIIFFIFGFDLKASNERKSTGTSNY